MEKLINFGLNEIVQQRVLSVQVWPISTLKVQQVFKGLKFQSREIYIMVSGKIQLITVSHKYFFYLFGEFKETKIWIAVLHDD